MKLGDLLLHLVKISGGDEKDATVVAALQNGEIFKFDISDAVSSKIQSELHTMQSARSSLTPILRAEIFNAIDKEMEREYPNLGIDDATISELKSLGKTSERAIMLAKKVQALEAGKKKADPKDKEAIAIEIENAKKAYKAEADKQYQTATIALKNEYEGKIVDIKFDNILSGFNYALPKELPLNAKIASAKAVLNDAFQKQEVKVINHNGQPKLVKNDGTDFFVNNVKQELGDFVHSVLNENKMLTVTDNSNSGSGNNNNDQHFQGGKANPNAKYLKEIEDRIALELASPAA